METTELRVYNSFGKLVYQKLYPAELQINQLVEMNKAGLYLIVIENSAKLFYEKVIVAE